jgi:D-glycero-D-manno-heptose 1,7-bisphosphate phosphatase
VNGAPPPRRCGAAGATALRPAAFLDRDGVINEDRGYVHRAEDFRLLPGVVEALQLLGRAYRLVVVTNQSGIARGYYTEAQHHALSAHLCALLRPAGVALAGIYHCPHHPEAALAQWRWDCDCRKPAPGLVLRAAAELGLDLPASLLAGDRGSDIAAGRAAGVGRCFLIGDDREAQAAGADGAFASLLDCAKAVLR